MKNHTEHSSNSQFDNCLYILYGSRTGNSFSAAQVASKYANHLGIKTQLLDMRTMDLTLTGKIKYLLIAVSTHGEGDPPAVAQKFYNYLHHTFTSSLQELKFSVLALGDSSYKDYCKTGKDFDKRLKNLNAQCISPLMECDVDFENNAKLWIETSINKFADLLSPSKKEQTKPFSFNFHSNSTDDNSLQVTVKEKHLLSHENSHDQTYHFSLSHENSHLEYKPGDSIGIPCYNSRLFVDRLLKKLDYDGTYPIREKEQIRLLKQVLTEDYELSLLTPVVVNKYAALVQNTKLNQIVQNQTELNSYCQNHDTLDLVTDFSGKLSIEEFLSVLRKLKPRLYSVASSSLKYPNEVHLTLKSMNYSLNNREHIGVTSSFLSHRIEKNETLSIYIEDNESFRLPENTNQPIIMVGNGTGIASFRAFLQEREQLGAKGDNWLLFGEKNAKFNFLYKDEITEFVNKGVLTRLDTAFSRDQKEKIYVQDKIKEYGRDIYKWLIDRNATIYLCGSKRTMAKGVRKAMQDVFCSEGNLSKKEALDLIAQMKERKQWQEDVY